MKQTILSLFIFIFCCCSLFAQFEFNQQTLSTLSLRDKIGQLCFIAAASDEKHDAELIHNWFLWQPEYHLEATEINRLLLEEKIGGIIFYGRKALPENQMELTKHFQALSKIPLLIALDAEVGLGGRLNENCAARMPYNLTIGATNDLALAYKTGFLVGQQLRMLGVHINFAPVVDINSNPLNPVIGMRSFGDDKELVAEFGIAYMEGLQDAKVIACAKHFPGHGDTTVDSHLDLPLIPHSREYLQENELYPFQKLINAGVKSIMTAHLEIPALEKSKEMPSSISKAIVTDLLQEEMGFKGLIFTDALGMKGASNYFEEGELCLKAIQAGNDVLLCPMNPQRVINRIEKAVNDGEISEDEIDKKVLKIFKLKKWAFKNRSQKGIEEISPSQGEFNSEEIKNLRKEIYEKAITVSKPKSYVIQEFSLENSLIINTDPSLLEFETLIKTKTDLLFFQESFKHDSFNFFKYFKNKFNWYFGAFRKATHFIVTITDHSFETRDQLIIGLKKLEGWKNEGKKITLISFCNPYLIPDTLGFDLVINCYENSVESQRALFEKFFKSALNKK